MKRPTIEEQRRLVKQWKETGVTLEKIRAEALRGMPYNWKDVDALLQLGDLSPIPSRTTSGLVEMQKYFLKARKTKSQQ